MNKKLKVVLNAYAVTQKDYSVDLDDLFETRRAAVQYRDNAFSPEHEAKIVRVRIVIEEK